MLKDNFDVVVILTESDLSNEPHANRFHWSRMLRDSGIKTVLVQPQHDGMKNIEGLEGITLLYGGPEAFEQKYLKGIINSDQRILFWNYGSIYSEVIPRNRGFLIHHATEDYLNSSFPRLNMDEYLGDLLRLMSRADLVIAVSEGVASNIRKVLRPDVPLRVIQNAYDPTTFYLEDFGPRSKTFLFQGGVNARIDWSFISELAEVYKDYNFHFYGPVNLPRSVLNKKPKNVEFFGQVGGDELRRAMNSAMIGLIPFKNESWLQGSFPLKYFEYLACGLPVYASAIDSVFAQKSGAYEISSLIPRTIIPEFDEGEFQRISEILTSNTYKSRFSELEALLRHQGVPIRSHLPVLRVCVLYDSASLSVETIREHVLSLSQLKNCDVYFISIRTKYFRDFNSFDVLISHYSVRLCYQWHLPKRFKKKFSSFKGLKCAFLQDEYDQTDIAAQSIHDLGITLVFTCVNPVNLRRVYPSLVDKNVKFKQVLTGFAFAPGEKDDFVKELPDRKWDLGYRGRKLSHKYGRLGFDKWRIGEETLKLLGNSNFRLNISSEELDRIYGDSWFRFLGECRAVLGTESGSNIFDHDGSLELLSQKESKMDYLDFERKHLDGLEIEGLMNQISPRIFEAISTKTALVLFTGGYSGVLEPWVHFFPLEKDFSNVKALESFLTNDEAITLMTKRAYEDIVMSQKFSRAVFIETINETIRENLTSFKSKKSKPIAEVFRSFPSNYVPGSDSDWTQKNPYRIVRIVWRRIPPRIRYRFAWYVPVFVKLIKLVSDIFELFLSYIKSFYPGRKR